jgi:membrane glycosyltransferase
VAVQGGLIFCITFFLLLSPQLFSLLDLCLNRPRRRAFGGGWTALAGIMLETSLSILQAPLLMLWHAVFVITIPWGKGITWTSQSRSQEETLSWRDAVRTHGWQTGVGLIWTMVAYAYSKWFLIWMTPILIPLIFSIPLNLVLSSARAGRLLRRGGILLTPEEHQVPRELADLAHAEQQLAAILEKIHGSAAILALVDPYINALHVTLQRQFGGDFGASRIERDNGWLKGFLKQNPSEIGRPAFRALLANAEDCRLLHLELWRTLDGEVAAEWADAVAIYSPAQNFDLLTDDVVPVKK